VKERRNKTRGAQQTVDKNQSKSTRDLSCVNKSPEVIEKVPRQGSAKVVGWPLANCVPIEGFKTFNVPTSYFFL